ncbi:MAG: ATP-binding protein [Candidatus Zixiibacteriota bacterium]
MVSRGHIQRTTWFVPLRLASFVILFAVVVLWMHYPRFLQLWLVFYSILTLCLTLLVAFDRRRHLPSVTDIVIGLQLLVEIALESGIIFATGNIHSPFSALFILTIVSAALSYRLVGTLVVASLVSLAYTFIIWLGLSNTISPGLSLKALETVFSARDTVFYAIFLHLLIFYLVAFISGYLAERIKAQDQRLDDASRALKRARLETDDILRHLNSGLLTIDAAGHIIFFNRAAERILGCREDQVRGLSCEIVLADRMPQFADLLMAGIQEGETYPRREIEIIGANGECVPVGVSTSILTEENGALRGVIAIFSDLTDVKRLEDKVRAADRLAAVGELSASIAHEIRNPLASISGSVQVLKNDLGVEGENAHLMDLIVKESDRLTRISNDFLQYARITDPSFSKVELCHLISETIQTLRHHESYSPGIDIRFESDHSIVYVIGDEDLIKQLLVNLAVNACEALAERGGELTFNVSTEQGETGTVMLTVHDNGPGIPEQHLNRIYEPFFSTKKQGTGLGLAIVHRIVTALKLYMNVETTPGYGAGFQIEFKQYGVREIEPSEDQAAASLPVIE